MRGVTIILLCCFCTIAHGQDDRRIADSIKEEQEIAALQKKNETYERGMERKYGKANIQKVRNGNVWVGISDELCLYGLTEPNIRKATYTKDGKAELWIYRGQAAGCIGNGCPYLDYAITFKNHKAVAITTGD